MKVIAFDLDDTLLRDDLSISSYTVGVLKELHDNGCLIIPASGRARNSMKPFIDRIGCTNFFISCNGAEIWDSGSGELLHNALFPVSVCHEIVVYGESNHCYTQTYDHDRFYYSEECKWAEMYRKSSMLPGTCVGSLLSYIKEPRSKILMMDRPEKIEEMRICASRLFTGKASVTCSKPYFLEFNPPDATKGRALRFISVLTGIKTDEFICFGDSINDLSMLKGFGTCVAVSNARDDVRRFVTKTCQSNNDDGVAHYLEKNYLSSF